MKVAVMRDIDRLEATSRPKPLPMQDQVAIDIRSVGICGPDAAYLHYGRIGPWKVEGAHRPRARDIRRDPRRGGWDRRLGRGTTRGGRARCPLPHVCRMSSWGLSPLFRSSLSSDPSHDGCLAERIVIDAACANPIPDSMSFDQAALVEPASVGLWASRRAGLKPGESVLVVGAGRVGILAALTAKALAAW